MSLQKTKSNTLRSITVERHHNSTGNRPVAIARLEHHIDVLRNLLQLLSSMFVQQGEIARLRTLMVGTQQVQEINDMQRVVKRQMRYNVISRNASILDSLIINILLSRLKLQAKTTH
jgi:hypothetical protein